MAHLHVTADAGRRCANFLGRWGKPSSTRSDFPARFLAAGRRFLARPRGQRDAFAVSHASTTAHDLAGSIPVASPF